MAKAKAIKTPYRVDQIRGAMGTQLVRIMAGPHNAMADHICHIGLSTESLAVRRATAEFIIEAVNFYAAHKNNTTR